jgi:hypothetical protein
MFSIETLEFSNACTAAEGGKVVTTVTVGVDYDSLPDVTKSAIVAYGMTQLVRDGAAVSKEDIAKAFADGGPDGVAKLLQEAVNARVEKMKTGTLGSRTRGPVDPEEREFMAILAGLVKAAAAEVGKKLDAEKTKETIGKLLVSADPGHVEKIAEARKEAKRRVKAASAAKSAAGGSLSSLF